MAHLLGAATAPALAAAESLGIAMQLTNILRDVGDDLSHGRMYLPEDDLRRFALSREDVCQLYHAGRGPDERFRALMRYQIDRAHAYYARGMAGIWLIPSESRLPILIAARLYRRILTVIERNHCDVFRRRAATTRLEKLAEAGRAFALQRLWRGGERTSAAALAEAYEQSELPLAAERQDGGGAR
jgi:phytoene synthase